MVKKEFRKSALKKLNSIPKFQRYAIDKKISSKLETLINKLNPKSILFYLPMPIEVDLRELIKRYHFLFIFFATRSVMDVWERLQNVPAPLFYTYIKK